MAHAEQKSTEKYVSFCCDSASWLVIAHFLFVCCDNFAHFCCFRCVLRLAVRAVKSLDEFINIHVRFAQLETWDLGKHDAATFFAADPNGFFGGELGQACLVYISLCAVTYRSCISQLCLWRDILRRLWFRWLLCVFERAPWKRVCVGRLGSLPDRLVCRYGLAVWKHMQEYLKGCKTVALDGVLEQEANYVKSGFKTAFNIVRYKAVASVVPEGTDKKVLSVPLCVLHCCALQSDRSIVPVSSVPFEKRTHRLCCSFHSCLRCSEGLP